MAKTYVIKCPTCGQDFGVIKGILVSESEHNPIPKDRRDETPFDCPFCGHTMSLEDEVFNNHVISIIMVD